MAPTSVLREQWFLAATLVLSLGVHAVTIGVLPGATARQVERKVEMAFYEPPATPKVEVPRPIVKQVAVKAPPRPQVEAPSAVLAMVTAGISRPSTIDTGAVVVPIGNTSLEKVEKVLAEVHAYSAPKYAPPGSADTEPFPLGEVKVPYPEEAQQNGIEGSVLLNVTVDASGVVTAVSVIRGPGYGLNEAAREAMKRFKFKPAMKGGEAVGTSFVYTYTFALE